ncbi:MAG TPA: MFS transporter, partial [Micromonosporaceae bacterium]
VTALVFTVTDSVLLSAASFAIGYLPGLTFGPPLAALAERYPHRQVMITCDVVRAVLISLVAIPNLPVPAILLLLFATALLTPAFDASRSSLLPRILEGDRYVVGVAAQTTTTNLATIFGYVVGGALAPFHPHLALLIDAATFLGSAAILAAGIKPRAVIATAARRARLITETVAGFRLVLQSPVLRPIAAIVFFGAMFAVVPEGLAAAWASDLSGKGGGARGFDQALIMASAPVGAVIGAIVIGRMVSPELRQRLVRPLAVLVPAALVPVFLVHSVTVIAVLSLISSFAVNGLAAPANGMFVRATPAEFRARAFGVMQFSLQLSQGLALLITGFVAGFVRVPTAVALFSVLGVCAMVAVSATWPSMTRINDTIAAVQAHNELTVAAAEAVASEGAVAAADDAGPFVGRNRRPISPIAPAPHQAKPSDSRRGHVGRHRESRAATPAGRIPRAAEPADDAASVAEPQEDAPSRPDTSPVDRPSRDSASLAAANARLEPTSTADTVRIEPVKDAGPVPAPSEGRRADDRKRDNAGETAGPTSTGDSTAHNGYPNEAFISDGPAMPAAVNQHGTPRPHMSTNGYAAARVVDRATGRASESPAG